MNPNQSVQRDQSYLAKVSTVILTVFNHGGYDFIRVDKLDFIELCLDALVDTITHENEVMGTPFSS